MQNINIRPMTLSADCLEHRRRQDLLVLALIAALLMCWNAVAVSCCLIEMQRVADIEDRV